MRSAVASAGNFSARSRLRLLPVLAALLLTMGGPAAAETPSITAVSPGELFYSTAVALPIILTVHGSGFANGAQVLFNGSPFTTTFVSPSKLTASVSAVLPVEGNVGLIVVSNPGSVQSAPFEIQLGVNAPKIPYLAAFRFLEQATWGPTTQDLVKIQQTGTEGWLSAQKTAKESMFPNPPTGAPKDYAQSLFMYNAMNGPDQLRQRVAFTLGQILVVSENKLQVEAIVPYLQLLQDNAFGNYRSLLQAVTLSPSMGRYLDMVDNAKPNLVKGTLPNENYAREFMQLFTIGTIQLNMDATPKLDASGNTIPLYGEPDIQNLARVFTGWTFPPGGTPDGESKLLNPPYYIGQMVPVDVLHDTDPKTFLGKTLPGGQNAQTDLSQALDIIFNHPNVGPFVSLRLIQHLVTSNPSSAYVTRIAKVFNNNGAGVRGDLWATVNAILNDPEARQADNPAKPIANGGHMREPVLYTTSLLRALGASVGASNTLAEKMAVMGQTLLIPPSVFNYYSPFYRIPGGAAAGPEFQLFSPASAVVRADFAVELLLSKLGPDTAVDLTPFVQLAASPGALMDGVSNALMGGQMPSAMRSTIMTAMAASSDQPTQAFDALYLTAGSGLFQIEQ